MALDFLGRWTQTRRALKALDRLATAQEVLAHDLHRLADHLCGPEQLAPASSEDLRQTGASYVRDAEQVKIQAFVERVWVDQGRQPSDDEIVRFLDGVEV